MDGKGNKRKRHEKARKTTAPPIVNPRSIHERDIAGLEVRTRHHWRTVQQVTDRLQAPHPTYDLLWSIEEPPDDLTTVQLPGINTDAVQDQLRNKNFESSELGTLTWLRSGSVLPLLWAFSKDLKQHAVVSSSR